MNITLDFLQNEDLSEEELIIQEKALEILYDDVLDFIKTEKDFWVEEIKAGLRENKLYGKLKKKQLDFLALKTWMGINKKNVRQAFPIETVFECYEQFEYVEENDEFILVRKPDDEEDLNEISEEEKTE